MRKRINIDVSNEDLIGFASNVTGATFVLTANVVPDGLAHKISIRNDSVTNHSAKTMTLVGIDQDGFALTQVIAGPGASATVQSLGYFLMLTSVTPSATIGADTFDIGWVDEVASRIIPIDYMSVNPASIFVDVTGTINYTVQQTLDNVLTSAAAARAAQWTPDTTAESRTADSIGSMLAGSSAVRIIINSYSPNAELQFYVNQSVGGHL